MDARRREAVLRRMRKAGGIRVVCLRCEARSRHDPEAGTRLREKRCRACGGRLRAVWWVVRFPTRALDAQRRERESMVQT